MMNYRNEQKRRSDGPSGGLLFNPLLNTGLNLNLALIAQGLVYLSAEYLQGWRCFLATASQGPCSSAWPLPG